MLSFLQLASWTCKTVAKPTKTTLPITKLSKFDVSWVSQSGLPNSVCWGELSFLHVFEGQSREDFELGFHVLFMWYIHCYWK